MNFLSGSIFAVACLIWLMPFFFVIHYQNIDDPMTNEQRLANGLACRDALFSNVIAAILFIFFNHYEKLPRLTTNVTIALFVVFALTVLYCSILIRGGMERRTQMNELWSSEKTMRFSLILYAFVEIIYLWAFFENYRDGRYEGIEVYGFFDVWEPLMISVYAAVIIATLIRISKERRQAKESPEESLKTDN